MPHDTHFQTLLQAHLGWSHFRIKFLVLFLMALIKVRSVNLTRIATAFNANALIASNYRRIQRFLAHCEIDYAVFARLILHLFPITGDYIISIDRTNWRFGRWEINVLMAAVVYRGTAIPLLWHLLDKQGSSSCDERNALLDELLTILPRERIGAIVADREFIGYMWLSRLCSDRLPFYIRIRNNSVVTHRGKAKAAKKVFGHLVVGQSSRLRKRRLVFGLDLFVSALRLEEELLVVITNADGHGALSFYKLRWSIEVLFSQLKKRGFNFEETHLREGERLRKLLALMTLAFSWVHLVGEAVARVRPPRLRGHGRKEKSLFRLGLDHLQQVLFAWPLKRGDLELYLWLLAGPLILALELQN